MVQPFTHLDDDGKLRMVDMSDKDATLRSAEASCFVISGIDVLALGASSNGLDIIHAARLAGIQAAKRTADIIPLCHPISLNNVRVDVVSGQRGVEVHSEVVTFSRTGVEMEALAACAMAALSLVSAVAHVDPTIRFEDLVLLRKSGGRSGDWGRSVGSSRQ